MMQPMKPIKQILLERRKSWKSIAKASGVSRTTLWRVALGRCDPLVSTVDRIRLVAVKHRADK